MHQLSVLLSLKQFSILWDELQSQHMPEPTEVVIKTTAVDFFDAWDFPHCVEAIDGKHVRVRCPANSGSMFYN
ncbi:hypothetical protein RRG08_057696 [Elysia crispata]|uniref:Nuclease HARBI1 n=1 Tax=Elysia crispata TaxID=231223 RepID=A0AAE1AEB1_9GAST|nr:hypothetical protein RRG08_057696 [Elysia crispata]